MRKQLLPLANDMELVTTSPEVRRVWGTPQQAFLRATGHAKIAGVGTPALLAKPCNPGCSNENNDFRRVDDGFRNKVDGSSAHPYNKNICYRI